MAEKLLDRKSDDVKLHPIIKKMIGGEAVMKMEARETKSSASGPAVKTKIVKPKANAVPSEMSSKTKYKLRK